MSTKQKSGGAVKGWGILRRGTPRPSDGAQGAPYCDEILSEEGNILKKEWLGPPPWINQA